MEKGEGLGWGKKKREEMGRLQVELHNPNFEGEETITSREI